MHCTEGVHPPLHCFSQMLLFGGEGMFGNPTPESPGLYRAHQGVSPCAGLPHTLATATEDRPVL